MALPDSIQRETLDPAACKALIPEAPTSMWCYRYTEKARRWTLSIATLGAPGSQLFSVAGFRIFSKERSSSPSSDKEAINRALCMGQTVAWLQRIKICGPLTLKNLDRIVGGYCIRNVSQNGTIGEEHDFAALDFVAHCFQDFETQSDVTLIVDQEPGRRVMSDGRTSTLSYLNKKFERCIAENTSQITSQGTYYMLKGMLAGFGLEMEEAKIGFLGSGEVSEHLVTQVVNVGATGQAIEDNSRAIERLRDLGLEVWSSTDKQQFLQLPHHALCLNGDGGSMDHRAILKVCRNPSIRFICGTEMFAIQDPGDNKVLLSAEKLYCPSELGSVMSAVATCESSLSQAANTTFRIESLLPQTQKLEDAGREAAAFTRRKGFSFLFEEGVRQVFM